MNLCQKSPHNQLFPIQTHHNNSIPPPTFFPSPYILTQAWQGLTWAGVFESLIILKTYGPIGVRKWVVQIGLNWPIRSHSPLPQQPLPQTNLFVYTTIITIHQYNHTHPFPPLPAIFPFSPYPSLMPYQNLIHQIITASPHNHYLLLYNNHATIPHTDNIFTLHNKTTTSFLSTQSTSTPPPP